MSSQDLSSRLERQWAGELAGFLLVFSACMVTKVAFNRRFFFHDDMQHQFLPVFYEIGRHLRSGRWPTELSSTWFGGDLLVEYQYAIFNPLSLAQYLVLPSLDSLVAAATFVAVSWYFLLCAGAFAFVRSQAPLSHALLAVAILATNPLISYWFASSWMPGLASLAWFPWLLFGMAASSLRRTTRGVIVAISCAGIATAGWPHALVAAALIIAAHALWHMNSPKSFLQYSMTIALPAAGAVLLAAPAWMPILLSVDSMSRPALITNNPYFFVAVLGAIANAGFPTHLDFMVGFNGFDLTSTPFYFIAPALFAIALMLRATDLRKLLHDDYFGPSLFLIGAFYVLSLGPATLGPIRWPFRFMLYGVLLVSLVLPVAIHQGVKITRERLLLGIGICLLSAFLAWQKSPQLWRDHFHSLLLVLVTFLVAAWFVHVKRPAMMIMSVIGFTIVCSAYIHLLFPSNTAVADWYPPDRVSKFDRPPGVSQSDLVLFISGKAVSGQVGGPEMYSGNIHLLAGVSAVNGYSPLRSRHLGETFCFAQFGNTCDLVSTALVEPIAGFNMTAVELSGITKVVVQNSRKRVVDAITASPRFDECGTTSSATVFCVAPPQQRLLPITWTSSSVSAQPVDTTDQRLLVTTSNNANEPGAIALAAPWRPGYVAQYLHVSGSTFSEALRPHSTGAVVLSVPAAFVGQIALKRGLPQSFVVLTVSAIGAVILLLLLFGSSLRFPQKATKPAPSLQGL